MHLLFMALLSILAGVLLLAKTRKEQLGKFFTYISWFFVVVGFLLFIGFLGGGIYRMSHGFRPGRPPMHQRMMMRGHPVGMEKGKCCMMGEKAGICCPEGMQKGECCKGGMMEGKCCRKMEGMNKDSMMKCCPAHAKADSLKLP
jgi:hypothetical protein